MIIADKRIYCLLCKRSRRLLGEGPSSGIVKCVREGSMPAPSALLAHLTTGNLSRVFVANSTHKTIHGQGGAAAVLSSGVWCSDLYMAARSRHNGRGSQDHAW